MTAASTTPPRAWLAYLAVGMSASVLAALTGSLVVIGGTAMVLGSCSTVAVWRAGRSGRSGRSADRPWLFLAATAGLFVLGNVVRLIDGMIQGRTAPFPSPADAILLIGHLATIIGGTLLGHLRAPDRDRAVFIDGAIIAIGLQTPVWAWYLWPYLTEGTVPFDQRLLNGAYSVMTTALLIVIGRLAVGPGARTPAYRLLASAAVLVFVQDFLATVNTTDGLPWRIDRMLAAPCFVLLGAAALHPGRDRITEAAKTMDRTLTTRRILTLAAALLIVPTIICLQLITDRAPTLWVAAFSLSALLILVMARFALLARDQNRATATRTIQRDANAAFAGATNRPAMYAAALDAVDRLIEDPDATTAIVTLADVAPSVQARLSRHTPTELTEEEASEQGLDGRQVVVFPLDVQDEVVGALTIATATELNAVVRQNVEMMTTTLSLALEGADLSESRIRQSSERRFHALIERSSDIVLVVDDDRLISFATPATRRLLGLNSDDLIGLHPAQLVHPEDWVPLAQRLAGHTPTDATDDVDIRIRHNDGTYRWFEIRTRDLRADPEINGLVVNAREVSDRKATERELADQQARYRAVIQNSSDVVVIIDRAGRFDYVSPAAEALVGLTPEEIVGRSALDFIAPEGRAAFRGLYPQLAREKLGADLNVRHLQTIVLHTNGELRHVSATVTDMRNEPSVAGLVLNIRDVTEQNRLERNLRYQALHDSLTGLPNRTLFTQQIDAAMVASEDVPADVGVLVIDVDDFKIVNDGLGHAAGDELLRIVALRLSRRLDPTHLVARLGGDEFAVLVTDTPGGRLARDVADAVLDIFARPFVVRGKEVDVSASIGIATSVEATTGEILLRSADTAMYAAKDRGKSRASVFEDHLHQNAFTRFELKADLPRAIEQRQLICHYQPIVSLQTGRISGVEALVRWNHPQRGMVPPNSFIPLAEETGAIVPIGRFVLQEACRQLSEWEPLLSADATLSMSINLSVRQLEHDGLVEEVRCAIADAGVDPRRITLEITETGLVQDAERAVRQLHKLRDLGVALAIDDFGTGYSSLGYVQRFPIDSIKIDRSFVSGLHTLAGENAVVQSMIDLAGRLGIHTVAEGIDRPELITLLREMGVDLGQGYLFSPPVSPSTIADMLVAGIDHDVQLRRP